MSIRTSRFELRLTEDEHKKLVAAARAAKTNVSDFIRERCGLKASKIPPRGGKNDDTRCDMCRRVDSPGCSRCRPAA